MPAGANGTLLRLESLAADDGKRVYRSMYLSTLVDGVTQLPVTGTIWVPAGDPPPDGFPIVAWGPGSNPHALGIFGDGCAYSARPIHPETDHQDHFANLLADGFVVTTTDYAGHGTRFPFHYTIGETDAHALVDAARAARDLLGSAASDRVIVAGFSLGGVAAHQALLHLDSYDQGLDVRGVVSIEGIGDFAEGEPSVPGQVGIQETMFSAYSWPLAYPELRAEDVLTAEGLRLLGELHENGCVWFSQYDEVEVLDASIPDWLAVPAWEARIRAQTVTETAYPVFYVVAEDNPRYDAIRAGAERLCQTADHVALGVFPGTDHYSVISAAYDAWVPWMQERVSSDEPFDGCTF
jgi:pimeloyl-ACP methyl ester carboxylesterase